MERTAIELSGRVGSLYDGYRDYILDLKVNEKEIVTESKKSVRQCELINGNTQRTQNLLEMIDIEADSRLSILLNVASGTGVHALIDCQYDQDEYTRLLWFSYIDRVERLDDRTRELPELLKSLDPKTNATHMITCIPWGSTVVVRLQIRSEPETARTIDNILAKVVAFIKGNHNDERFSVDDEELLEKNVTINVYSNIPNLRHITSLFSVCQYMFGCRGPFHTYRPLKYFLKPIKELYPQFASKDKFYPLHAKLTSSLEQHLISVLNKMNKLKYSLYSTLPHLIGEHLNDQISAAQQKWINVHNKHKEQTKRLKSFVIDSRSTNSNIYDINAILNKDTQGQLNNSIEMLTEILSELEEKGKFIADLQTRHFRYCNVAGLNANEKNYEQVLVDKLTDNKKEYRIICSNDALYKKNQSKIDQLTKKWEVNQDLVLIYADFSYCSFALSNMIILPSDKKNHNNKRHIMRQCMSVSRSKDIINILLIGESGVGKSTFVNALANYLIFKTMDDAASNEPIALIPVSFFLTTGENFEERTVKLGVIDDFNNEDFDHPGHSVTQHCKSYVFHLNQNNGKKLRIIDTPGFGDTRGINQDDLNMQHILKYINNLSHLNAICFLLKSNTAKIDNYFSTCIDQMIDFIGPNIRPNIVFCFTNARSSFYTPGSTTSLLKNILKSLENNEIPFKKENTFCFDNEPFRYLVALENQIQFNTDEKQQYEMSWSTSVNESNRLINYINTQLKIYPLSSQRQSIKHAQIQITYMIRPMLEAMRNLLRHVVLKEKNISNKSIKLHPIAIYRPASICYVCKSDKIKIGDFFMGNDDPHEMYKRCHICSCNLNEHSSIDYILQYELLGRSLNYNLDGIGEMIRELRRGGNIFAHFLMRIARATTDDPFLMGLIQMNIQEREIGHDPRLQTFNLELANNLEKLRQTYEKNMNSTKDYDKLAYIYEWINRIHDIPEVYGQMKVIKESQQMIMKEYEYEIVADRVK